MSTVFLYTCPEFVIRAAPKEQPRTLFVFTIRGDYCVMEKLHARAVRSHLESSFCALPRLWCFAAMSSVRSDSVGSGMTAASGDQGQEMHYVSFKGQQLIDAQTVLRAAKQETNLVGRTPLLASATAETRGSGPGRTPTAPYNERDDVGKMSVYQGNWGGNRANVALCIQHPGQRSQGEHPRLRSRRQNLQPLSAVVTQKRSWIHGPRLPTCILTRAASSFSKPQRQSSES